MFAWQTVKVLLLGESWTTASKEVDENNRSHAQNFERNKPVESDKPISHDALNQLLQEPTQILLEVLELVFPDVAFFSYDRDGRFSYLSKNSLAVFQQNPHFVLGESFFSAVSDDVRNFQSQNPPCASENKRTTKPMKCQIISGKGEMVNLWLLQSPLFLGGEFIGMTGIARKLAPEIQTAELLERAKMLSPRLRDVVELVVAGKMNKIIAQELGVAMRTVEARRSQAMKILKAPSHSQLVSIWLVIKQAEGKHQSLDELFHNQNLRDPRG